MRLLPYLHPLWQIGSIGLAVWTLSIGLRMRRLRKLADKVDDPGPALARAALVERHVRAGWVFLCAIATGFVAGPLLLGVVRGKPVFHSAHAFFATLTLLLVGSGGLLGWRLRRGLGGPEGRELHAYCMGCGLFLTAVAAMLGLGLLP